MNLVNFLDSFGLTFLNDLKRSVKEKVGWGIVQGKVDTTPISPSSSSSKKKASAKKSTTSTKKTTTTKKTSIKKK